MVEHHCLAHGGAWSGLLESGLSGSFWCPGSPWGWVISWWSSWGGPQPAYCWRANTLMVEPTLFSLHWYADPSIFIILHQCVWLFSSFSFWMENVENQQ